MYKPFKQPMNGNALAIITQKLWQQLETRPWVNSHSIAESLIWLLYYRLLDTETSLFDCRDNDIRWCFWYEMSSRARFSHLKKKIFPFLIEHAPMTGHLLGLILPTISFRIPDDFALQQLLDLIDSNENIDLLEACLPLLNIEEPSQEILSEIIQILNFQAHEIIWEPQCRSGRFLACSTKHLQKNYWQTIWANADRLMRFRQQQFFGRVQSRTEALFSAMNLLIAGQPSPGLDGYSLPWPAPTVIWSLSGSGLNRQTLMMNLAPAGRLVIWHPTPARHHRLPLSQGSLEIINAPWQNKVQEPHLAYGFHIKRQSFQHLAQTGSDWESRVS